MRQVVGIKFKKLISTACLTEGFDEVYLSLINCQLLENKDE